MGGEGDVLWAEFGIGTRKDCEDVGGGDFFAGGDEVDAGGEIEWEGGELGAFASIGDDLGGFVAGGGEERVQGGRIEPDGNGAVGVWCGCAPAR